MGMIPTGLGSASPTSLQPGQLCCLECARSGVLVATGPIVVKNGTSLCIEHALASEPLPVRQ